MRRSASLKQIEAHVTALLQCRDCPDMIGPVVTGTPVRSPVLLIGQAPGNREGPAGKPFAWTAGKTMFGWFSTLGVDEEAFRRLVYMAAVCRCFPGKAAGGGDRVPAADEIERCSRHLRAEVQMVRPQLVLPVGKLAIAQIFPEAGQLVEVVGRLHRTRFHGVDVDVVPLPHPSGASTWHRTEPGKSLLGDALGVIERHPAWDQIRAAAQPTRKAS
jgi:uracil-DNA glycosylase